MAYSLEKSEWTLLLERIKDGKCTPFLGAGACYGELPLGSEIARAWAKKFEYPLKDKSELARIAQFLAVKTDPMYAKNDIAKQIQAAATPDFNKLDEPHGVLADLPFPIYITTNYDDFMFQALTSRKKKPRREFCRWNDDEKEAGKKYKNIPLFFESSDVSDISPENPLVYHLHGYTGLPESLVLTEDDYLDFLVKISKDEKLIPPLIQLAMNESTLLFLGYKLADWDFRVLFRSLANMGRSSGYAHVSVQIITVKEGDGDGDVNSDTDKEKAQQYLDRYFEGQGKIHVYWGKCSDFVTELSNRWKEFNHDN